MPIGATAADFSPARGCGPSGRRRVSDRRGERRARRHPRRFLLKQEDDLWLVTLSGCAKDFPPDDEHGFVDFARTLAFPQIGDALPHAEPLSPIRSWRNTVNRMRHFERMPSWPESFVCVGDAVCSFNPVYGQGMTVAALGSLDLAAELEAEGRDGHARHRHRLPAPAGCDHQTTVGGRLPIRFRRARRRRWSRRLMASPSGSPSTSGSSPWAGMIRSSTRSWGLPTSW